MAILKLQWETVIESNLLSLELSTFTFAEILHNGIVCSYVEWVKFYALFDLNVFTIEIAK